MDLAGAQRLTCFLPTTSRLPSHIHDSRRNGTAIIFSYDGLARVGQADRLVRLGPASVRRSGTLTQIFPAPA